MIARVFAGLLIGALGFISPVAAQENEIEPELVWTCPVHRDVTENEAGNCEFCERELIQTLVQQAWSCPIHSVISERAPGKCPICARDLYLITEEVTFACPMPSRGERGRAGKLSHLQHGARTVDLDEAASGPQSETWRDVLHGAG